MLGQLQFRGWGRKVCKVSFPSSEGGEEKLRRFPSHHPTFYCRENTLLIHGVPWSQHFHFGGRRFKYFFLIKYCYFNYCYHYSSGFQELQEIFQFLGFFFKVLYQLGDGRESERNIVCRRKSYCVGRCRFRCLKVPKQCPSRHISSLL